jgi:hypothetical protein
MKYSLISLAICFALTTAPQCAPLPSQNAPPGQYENYLFQLPELAAPTSTYTIIILPEGGEAIRIELPKGATGIKLSTQALPKNQWTWRYALQSSVPIALKQVGEDRRKATPEELETFFNTVIVEWNLVTDAKAYDVVVSSAPKAKTGTDLTWGKAQTTECTTLTECIGPATGLGYKAIEVSEGRIYRWKVVARDLDGIAISESAYRFIETPKPTFGSFEERGWRLQRSETLNRLNAAKPALFAYSASAQSGETRAAAYVAQFALGWSPSGEYYFGMVPSASLEAKLTSNGVSKKTDELKLRLGATLSEPLIGEWSLNAKYETERKSGKNDGPGTKKGLLEINVSPLGHFGLGRFWPYPRETNAIRDSAGRVRPEFTVFTVMPTLNFGADFGKTFDVGTSEETARNIQRYHADFGLTANWNQLARLLNIRSVTATADTTFWYLRSATERVNRLSSVSLSFGLTPNVGFGIEYSVGKDAPNFTFERATNAGFEIKF